MEMGKCDVEWTFEDRGFAEGEGVGIVAMRGFLDGRATAQVTRAMAWALVSGRGPIVVDLTQLSGCSEDGRIILWQAATRAAARCQTVVLCGSLDLGSDPEPQGISVRVLRAR